ncbi:MAG: zinc-dependent metalloprotease [Acidimicrobiia bacterium]
MSEASAKQHAPASPVQAEVIDWGVTRLVARRVAGADPFADSYLSSSLTRDFAECTNRAAELVSAYTGLTVAGPTAGIVVSRREWIDSNVRSMQRLLAPLAERMGLRLGPLGMVSRRVTGVQSGIVLGFMAQRVLGQYDLFFADDTQTDAVFYVGGNILSLEKRFAFRPQAFRLWIALHEVTHRAQFAGVPWLRAYFLSLVDELFAHSEPDWEQMTRAARAAAVRIRNRQAPWDESGLLGLVASAEQRATIERIQALMTLLEGHGNAVMNALGQEHVEGQERMAATLAARRNPRGFMAIVQRLFGLEAKLRQYDLGERFVQRITDLGGPEAIRWAWTSPEALPTTLELEAPADWIARMRTATGSHAEDR